MNMQLLNLLTYILPVQRQRIKDKTIAITTKHFKALYGDLINNLLQHLNILSSSKLQLQKEELPAVISTIKELIDLSDDYCRVWKQGNNLIMMSSNQMKPNGVEIFLLQKSQGNIKPHDFMTEKKQASGFNDKCLVAMTFQSLIILFDKVLFQVRSIEGDEYFDLKVAQLFNIIDATNQLNMFAGAFYNKQSRRKGAQERAKLKSDVKYTINKIVKDLNIKNQDTTKRYISDTKTRVKNAYKEKINKTFPFNDKTLENYILDAPKS